ncbi:MAG: hypothetical protein HY327_10565 [Chloroflexi bacterium]|nr:hypothetical protein [Chloroflexota bacterium]
MPYAAVSQLPRVLQNENDLEVAARYAPIVMADAREPFTIIAAGYTIFDRAGESPSFAPRRRVDWDAAGYAATLAIEYALWWDWDIGHLYELEQVWTYVDASGAVVAVEASWHGMFGQLEVEGKPPVDGTHPIVYAQPGKHAMAAAPEIFSEIREWAEQEAGRDAGKGGVHDSELFRGQLPKTDQNDELVRAYLKRVALVPSWQFEKRLAVTREMLLPWDVLEEWIPKRIDWWIEKLQRGE